MLRRQDPQEDEVHAGVEIAFALLEATVQDWQRLTNRMTLLLSLTEDVVQNGRWCSSHARIGVQAVSHRFGDVGQLLSQRTSLCSACYDLVRRRTSRLPTIEEVRHYEETGKWRIHVDGAA
jgi:hypothetical protein